MKVKMFGHKQALNIYQDNQTADLSSVLLTSWSAGWSADQLVSDEKKQTSHIFLLNLKLDTTESVWWFL